MLASLAGAIGLRGQAAPDAFQYNIVAVKNTSPGEFPEITYSVVNPQTGKPYDLATDLAWTQLADGTSRLFLQVGWDTRDFTNTDSGSNLVPGGRGAALPIPINALGQFRPNRDGTYTVISPLPVPLSASGTGVVAMEGHPAGPDRDDRPVYRAGAGEERVPLFRHHRQRRGAKAPSCRQPQVHGLSSLRRYRVAPRLTAHGNNRTEEPQVCVVCHNPDNTDIPFRSSTHPKPTDRPYVFRSRASTSRR